MPAGGRYWNGEPWVHNPVAGTGIKLMQTSPAALLVGARWTNGLAVYDTELSGEFGAGRSGQGNDSFVCTGNSDVAYVHALNKDPGATGAPLVFAAGTEASLRKAVSLAAPSAAGRPKLEFYSYLTVVKTQPPADAFRPAPSTLPKTHKFTTADLDLSGLPNLAPVAGALTFEEAFARVRWSKAVEFTARPQGERYTADINEANYGSDEARRVADAALMLCLNTFDATQKRLIAAGITQIGLDVVGRLKTGGRYNFPGGLGGILAGFKLPVVLAATWLQDPELIGWANRLDWSSEDRQVIRVTQAWADDPQYDYIQDDVGMPEWCINPVKTKGAITRTLQGAAPPPQTSTNKSYRSVFTKHHAGQEMACRLIPGARAMWNNNDFFDYADRTMGTTIYKDPLSTASWAFYATSDATNRVPAFHREMRLAYRNEPGTGAVWNWS